jgi:O-antigen/teichoic acid export membrane protein
VLHRICGINIKGIAYIKQVVPLLRLTPFDVSSEEGRSKERYRRAVLTSIAQVASTGLSMLTVLITVPLTLGYLGPERYGVWMTISSIVTVLAFADLGIGNGLLNAVTEAHGKDDRLAASSYVSSAFFFLSGISLILAVVFALVYPFVPWAKVFNVTSPIAMAEAGPAMAVFFGCVLINVPLGMVQQVRLGYQEGFATSLWSAAGSVLRLGGVLLAIALQASLPWLVLAMTGGPAIAALMNSVEIFGVRKRWLLPRWRFVTSSALTRVAHAGFYFFLIQLSTTVAFSSDNIIAAQILGPEAVTQYAVPARMFSVMTMVLTMALTPLWPAYGESIARGDYQWSRKALSKSLTVIAMITIPVSLLLAGISPQLLQLWVGPQISPTWPLLIGLAIWTIVYSLGNAVSMFLNGANAMRPQMVMSVSMCVAAIVFKIIFTYLFDISGLPWGTVLAYSVFVCIPCILWVPRLLAKPNSRCLPMKEQG